MKKKRAGWSERRDVTRVSVTTDGRGGRRRRRDEKRGGSPEEAIDRAPGSSGSQTGKKVAERRGAGVGARGPGSDASGVRGVP